MRHTFTLAASALLVLGCAASAADWAQWRGPNRDGYSGAGEPAITRLPAEFKPAWRLAVGGGFSSPVVVGQTVIYMADVNGKETVVAADAATGAPKWQHPIADTFSDNWGAGPRSTPFVDGDRVYAQACNGEFRCLRLADGSVVWQTSFEKDFGVKFLGSTSKEGTATRRGNNGCGVIDGQRLILPVGGKGCSLVAFDKLTGKVLWNASDDEAAYSSFLVVNLAGTRQVVAYTADALLGADLTDGKILWRVPLKTGAKRHAGTPVIMGDRMVVNSQTIGLVCIQISREGEGLKATQAWANKQLRINVASPVFKDGFLYSQGANRDLVCVDAATGQLKWSQPGFGRGEKDNASIIVSGSNLLVLTEPGELVLVAANPEKYQELGRLQVCGSNWCYPAYSGGRLFFRDSRELFCLDLR